MVSAMATKAQGNLNKRFLLNRSIVHIVRDMYPISADEIFWEIGEGENRILSRLKLRKQLEQLCEHELLKKVTLPNDKVVYMMAEK